VCRLEISISGGGWMDGWGLVSALSYSPFWNPVSRSALPVRVNGGGFLFESTAY